MIGSRDTCDSMILLYNQNANSGESQQHAKKFAKIDVSGGSIRGAMKGIAMKRYEILERYLGI